jgi:mRNA interferase RelE/StbE
MTYSLAFLESAKKEWDALDKAVREQFKKKLKERLKLPRVEKDRLNGMKDCYKIKLLSAGFRLVYQVEDQKVRIVVVAVGKRERNKVYNIASKRI